MGYDYNLSQSYFCLYTNILETGNNSKKQQSTSKSFRVFIKKIASKTPPFNTSFKK